MAINYNDYFEYTCDGRSAVTLDSCSIDRLVDERPYYSDKHQQHGMNVQLLAGPVRQLVWASPALPGAVHDATALARSA